MNKKILVVLTFLIVVTGMTAVSAFDLGNIFGSGEAKNVTIEGFNFTIPAGFDESEQNDTQQAIESFKKDGFNITSKIYAKGSTVFSISIANATASGKVIDNDAFKASGNATKINNVDGVMNTDDDLKTFKYVKDDCLFVITTNDESILKEIVK